MSKNTMSKKNSGSISNTNISQKKKDKKSQDVEHNEDISGSTNSIVVQQQISTSEIKQKLTSKKIKNSSKENILIADKNIISNDNDTNVETTNDNVSDAETSGSKFMVTLEIIKKSLSDNVKELRETRNNLKKLETLYNHDVVKATKNNNKKKKARDLKPTGFGKLRAVPDKLAELVGIEKGTIMSRPEFTKKFYKLLDDRKLYYEGDRRVLRVDNEISRVLNISMDVNKSTNYKDDNGFNFYNVQKFIAKCYNEDVLEKEANHESDSEDEHIKNTSNNKKDITVSYN